MVTATGYSKLRMWHPFLPGKAFDNRLTEYDIVLCCPSVECNLYTFSYCDSLLRSVHYFFGRQFQNEEDRRVMRQTLLMGQIIAIFRKDGDKFVIVSALSFMSKDAVGIISYLATSAKYRSFGLGQLLLILMGKHLLHYNNRDIVFFLVTNKKHNEAAVAWYKNRGFVPVYKDHDNFKKFQDIIQGHVDQYQDNELDLFELNTFEKI